MRRPWAEDQRHHRNEAKEASSPRESACGAVHRAVGIDAALFALAPSISTIRMPFLAASAINPTQADCA